jgi:hypothetical protein
MVTNELTWFLGVALLLGGAIHAIASIPHLNNSDPQSLKSPLWTTLQVAFALSFLLIGLGILGVQARQGEQTGWLGLVGVALASVGALLTVTTSFMWGLVAPYLARQQTGQRPPNELLGPTGPIPAIFRLLLAYIVLMLPGLVLTAILTIRAGALPAAAGWLLLVGVIIAQPGNVVGRLAWLRNVGGVLMGAGLAWLGVALLSG